MTIMKFGSRAAVALAVLCRPTAAQQQETLTSLLDQGFEIKAATTGGVVLQKGKEAFSCGFLIVSFCFSLRSPRLACGTDLLVPKEGASGNDPDNFARIALPAGTEVQKKGEPKNGFVSVTTNDFKTGWVVTTAFDPASCPGASKP